MGKPKGKATSESIKDHLSMINDLSEHKNVNGVNRAVRTLIFDFSFIGADEELVNETHDTLLAAFKYSKALMKTEEETTHKRPTHLLGTVSGQYALAGKLNSSSRTLLAILAQTHPHTINRLLDAIE